VQVEYALVIFHQEHNISTLKRLKYHKKNKMASLLLLKYFEIKKNLPMTFLIAFDK